MSVGVLTAMIQNILDKCKLFLNKQANNVQQMAGDKWSTNNQPNTLCSCSCVCDMTCSLAGQTCNCKCIMLSFRCTSPPPTDALFPKHWYKEQNEHKQDIRVVFVKGEGGECNG